MRALGRVLIVLAMTALLRGAGPEVYNFPALVYGLDQWSVIRVANHGSVARSVYIEAYDERGQPVHLPKQTKVAPGMVQEVRIPFPPQTSSAIGWAQVRVPGRARAKEVEVTAAVEHLEQNKLLSVMRHSEQFQKRKEAFLLPVERSFLYLLNWDDHDVEVKYCWWAGPRRNACPDKNTIISNVRIRRGRALLARVGATRGRTLVLRMSRRTNMLLTGMTAANAATKDYLSDTTLSFDMSELTEDAAAATESQGR
jgi:hypothetical protein